MDVFECMSTRRSIRRFSQKKVDFETMLSIAEAGGHAPSSGNLQDWKFIIVDDKALMKSLSEASTSQECVQNAAFLIVVCSDPEQTERYYGLRGVRLYTIQNCAAATQNLILAAHALGIGSTWVGAFDEDKVMNVLNIPPQARPQAIVAFGYPDERPDHKATKALNIVTYFNSYGNKLKNPQRALKNYSVDIQRATQRTKDTVSRAANPAALKSVVSNLKEKGKKFFERKR